jgi:hypothetical protein
MDGEATPPQQKIEHALVLKLSADQISSGDTVEVIIENSDAANDFVYRYPGASSGCGAFKWTVHVSRDGESHYTNTMPQGPETLCTAEMIPPRDIVVPAGGQHKFTLNTQSLFFVKGPAGTFTSEKLAPGTYTVTTFSLGVPLKANLVVR